MENRRSFLSKGFLVLGSIGLTGFFFSVYKFFSQGNVTIPSKHGNSKIFTKGRHNRNNPHGSLRVIRNPDGSFGIKADTIPKGQSRITAMGGTPLIIVHSSNGFRAFNATCTHLGCLVKWDNANNNFFCPCHGGQYNKNGEVISGPPPSKLKEHIVTVTKANINIRLA